MRRYLDCLFIAFLASATSAAYADLKPEKVHVADAKKNKSYVKDGLVVGGDRSITDVIVRDIRHSNNGGFERVVIDMQGTLKGETVAIPRPPYFQLAVAQDERRLVVTVWGHPSLQFDSRKVVAAFRKSGVIQNIQLYPKLETDSWTFAFELKSNFMIETFELTKPTRVILDIQKKKG